MERERAAQHTVCLHLLLLLIGWNAVRGPLLLARRRRVIPELQGAHVLDGRIVRELLAVQERLIADHDPLVLNLDPDLVLNLTW